MDGERAHGDRAHGDRAHRDPAHGDPAQRDPAQRDPAHGELAYRGDRELQRLAYARATTPEEQARAAAAGEELARRAAAAEAQRATTTAAEQSEDAVPAEPAENHAENSAEDAAQNPALHAHRRRMRTVGLAGVLAAALALPGVAWALSLPDPDPLAIFDDQQDPAVVAALTELIGPDAMAAITSGPQLARFDGDIVAIAFRASTVPDGRSTVGDAYCLLTAREPDVGLEQESPQVVGGRCATPERFAEEGVIALAGPYPEETESSVDTVVWGPEGSPRLARDTPLDELEWAGSVTDALAYGALRPGGFASAPEIDGAERLVMGPAEIASSSAAEGGTLTVRAYLIESAVEGVQGLAPEYCLLVTVDDEETSTECAALPLVERQGLSVRSTEEGENWLVELGPDGSIRFDRS